MVKPRVFLTMAVAGAMVLAGCASTPIEDVETSEAMGHDHDETGEHYLLEWLMPDFEVEMKGCREGGGTSVYNSRVGAPGPAPPLTRADISYDVGFPKIATYGNPINSDHLTGIWHMTVVCDSYTYKGEDRGEFRMGWVGVRIDPPPWDESDIEYQFFIPDLSFLDAEIVRDTQSGALIHSSRMLEGVLEWMAPGKLHQVMDDEDHGVFQTHIAMQEFGAMKVDRIRFWIYADQTGNFNHGSHGHDTDPMLDHHPMDGWRPVAIDLVNHGGTRHWTGIDTNGWLSHTRSDHHGAAGGAAGNVGGVLWEGFDRTMTIGPAPEILLESTWLH